ncbi:hypothetical protein ADK55_04460 [Streptomyces sp. WM4235]|nr:hypothetical protein ADK55_04460 [Streptomyces sp. WM4235]
MRATRAALFAAVCVALGAVGHSYMSGMDVPLCGLLGAFGVICSLAWLAAGRRRGPVGITAGLLAAQGMLHLAFSGSQGAHPASMPMHAPRVADPAGTSPAHHHTTGMDMGAAGAGGGTTAPHEMADMAGMADLADLAGTAGHGHGGLGMIAAHVLAGLFCAAWLAWGEAAVFRLAGALGAAALLAARPLSRALALVRTRVALVPAPPAHCPPYERPRFLRGALHAHAVVRRGPPRRRDTRATAPGRPARA